jgi:hypothetical protein
MSERTYKNLGRQNSHPLDRMVKNEKGQIVSGREAYIGCFQFTDSYERTHRFCNIRQEQAKKESVDIVKKAVNLINIVDGSLDLLNHSLKTTQNIAHLSAEKAKLMELSKIKAIFVQQLTAMRLNVKLGKFSASYSNYKVDTALIIPNKAGILEAIGKIESKLKYLVPLHKAAELNDILYPLKKFTTLIKTAAKVSVLAIVDIVYKIYEAVHKFDAKKGWDNLSLHGNYKADKDGFAYALCSVVLTIVLVVVAIVVGGWVALIIAVIGVAGALYELFTGDDVITAGAMFLGQEAFAAGKKVYTIVSATTSRWYQQMNYKIEEAKKGFFDGIMQMMMPRELYERLYGYGR